MTATGLQDPWGGGAGTDLPTSQRSLPLSALHFSTAWVSAPQRLGLGGQVSRGPCPLGQGGAACTDPRLVPPGPLGGLCVAPDVQVGPWADPQA